MILRVVAGVTEGSAERPARGLVRSHLGTDRATGESVEVTIWDDAEAASGGATNGAGESPADRSGDGRAESNHEAAYFDVGSTWLEWSRDEPVAFRLAIGRFSRPRADLEMQDALRERVPLLGEDLTESAVGRRIVGSAVEVVFFTAWTRESGERPLEQALWPDIVLRYDQFGVRVCSPARPIVSRPPRP